MLADPTLLVVDDEEVICEGCRRIFSRQGFQVEKSSDPQQGLNLAVERDFKAILLDIKMPSMDGIQFLEQLRVKKPGVPVILMTGYPSIPNAASAVRLGASDYITKPFTPEEITQAVQRLLGEGDAASPEHQDDETWTPETGEFRFFNEAWFQAGRDGTVRVGAMVPRSDGMKVEDIRLPRVGEAVYQGLPMAGLIVDGAVVRTVPAPISGVVVAVNPLLKETASVLWRDPCWNGWIAAIAPTRLEADAERCTQRHVILASADKAAAGEQCQRLRGLGCDVRIVTDADQLLPALRVLEGAVVFVDAASFAAAGPEVVRKINSLAPSTKVVVLASPASEFETQYRQNKILYYAVEAFADHEIGEILDAGFRHKPAAVNGRKFTSEFLASISITNRNGKKVHLMAPGGLLRKDEGLGVKIRRGLLDRLFPMESSLGHGPITQLKIVEAARKSDHVVILVVKDTGRLPGSLLFDTKGEYISVPGDKAGKVTTIAVQPDASGAAAIEFDDRTTAALAEHIIQKMAEC
ncbi:MAG: response regulator [Thermoguttaceae bacterium]|nr:response regulator [Thermoguttaceae bacterium]